MAARGVINRIADAVIEATVELGYSPTRLYLGRNEMSELRRAAGQIRLMEEASIKGERPKFDGLPLFEVDAESHIGCGYGT